MKTMENVGVDSSLREATLDRWRANRWRMETSIEEIEGKVEKGGEESKGRGVQNERATK